MTMKSELKGLFTLLLMASTSFGATIRWQNQTVEVTSLIKKGAMYLDLKETADKLPISLCEDSTGKVFVICSSADCRAIFTDDESEVLVKGGRVFVQSSVIADVMRCLTLKEKKEISLACSEEKLIKVGSQTGDLAPGFRLLSQDSTLVSNDTLLASGPLLLMFVRSAEWDPFSITLIQAIQKRADSLHSAGFNIALVHGAEIFISKRCVKDQKLNFPVLSDRYSAVMRGYDVFDKGHMGKPSVFLLSSQGMIKLRHVFADVNSPPDIDPIMKVVREMTR